MARVINLDEIVPEDIEFSFRGENYAIPGDIDVDTTFDLVGIFGRFAEAEAAGDTEAMRAVNKELEGKLLRLFQLKDPGLESLPFGVIGYRHVLQAVLEAVGLQIVEGDPTPAPAPKPGPRPRSSGSPQSGKRSGSGRSGGAGSRS